jgi:hypothetical protein
MSTWRIAAVLTVVVSLSWTMPAGAQTLGIYDNFNSAPLDPDRWLGYEYSIYDYDSHPAALYGDPDWGSAGGDPQKQTSMRRVVGGQAQILLTSYRGTSGALFGGGGKARSGLRINHLALADHTPVVTAIRSTVTVVEASVPNPSPELWCRVQNVGLTRVELLGHFFNDGTSTGTEDLTGDVFAIVALKRLLNREDPGAPVLLDSVEASIGRCANANCSRIRRLTTHTFARTWATGVPHVLTIVWRPASNAFEFTVADASVTESVTVPYTVADETRVRGYAYDLRVETRPMRCYAEPIGAPNQVPHQVSIDARFDNVQLNSSAATATR